MGRKKRGRPSSLIDDLDRLLDVVIKGYRFIDQQVRERQGQDTPGQATDPYRILGVDPKSPVAEKKKRYKDLQRLVHPDRGGDQQLAALVNGAWEEICAREQIK